MIYVYVIGRDFGYWWLIMVLAQISVSDAASQLQDNTLSWCINPTPDDAPHAALERCLSYNGIERNQSGTRFVKPKLLEQQTSGITVKPSQNILGKVFACNCDSLRIVIAVESALLFSYDGFTSYSKIVIGPQLIEYGVPVESVALSDSLIFLVIDGKIFASEYRKSTILDFREVPVNGDAPSTPSARLLAVSGSTICFSGSHDIKENYQVYGWDKTSIFEFRTDIFEFNQVRVMLSDTGDGNFSIINVQMTANPHYLAVTSSSSNGIALQLCFHRRNNPCQIVSATQLNVTESQVLASAVYYFLIWENRSLTVVGNQSSIVRNFNETIETVSLSHRRNSWVVKTSDGTMFYESMHSTAPEKVDLTYPRNASIILLSEDILAIAVYSFGEVVDIAVHDINSLIRSPGQVIFQHHQIPSKNVVVLGSVSAGANIDLTVTADVADPYNIEVYTRFGELPLRTDITKQMTTFRISPNTLLRERKTRVTLLSNCLLNPNEGLCPVGYGLIELAYIPNEIHNRNISYSSTNHMRSYLYVVNVTCPSGLHLRLGNVGPELANCSSNGNFCILRLAKEKNLHLKFQLWRYNDFVEDVYGDILLTELRDVTGFEYHDVNLLKRSCYHCANFHETALSSQLILQTVYSACPCKVNDVNHNKWIGNISFSNVYSSSDRTILRFSAKVLGDSFCDLTNEFTVELVSDPDLIFDFLEYVSMLVSLTIAVGFLFLSYYNYFKRARDKQIRLSIMK